MGIVAEHIISFSADYERSYQGVGRRRVPVREQKVSGGERLPLPYGRRPHPSVLQQGQPSPGRILPNPGSGEPDKLGEDHGRGDELRAEFPLDEFLNRVPGLFIRREFEGQQKPRVGYSCRRQFLLDSSSSASSMSYSSLPTTLPARIGGTALIRSPLSPSGP